MFPVPFPTAKPQQFHVLAHIIPLLFTYNFVQNRFPTVEFGVFFFLMDIENGTSRKTHLQFSSMISTLHVMVQSICYHYHRNMRILILLCNHRERENNLLILWGRILKLFFRLFIFLFLINEFLK